MDTKYYVYFYIFKDYRNPFKGIKSRVKGNVQYGKFPILKVGISRYDLNRIEENAKRETKDRFIDIWGEIELYGKVLVDSIEQAKHYESKLLKVLGKKDFWIDEKPTGITEMRVWTKDRKDIVDFFIKEFS